MELRGAEKTNKLITLSKYTLHRYFRSIRLFSGETVDCMGFFLAQDLYVERVAIV